MIFRFIVIKPWWKFLLQPKTRLMLMGIWFKGHMILIIRYIFSSSSLCGLTFICFGIRFFLGNYDCFVLRILSIIILKRDFCVCICVAWYVWNERLLRIYFLLYIYILIVFLWMDLVQLLRKLSLCFPLKFNDKFS